MRININSGDPVKGGEQPLLEITDEGLDNDNYVNLFMFGTGVEVLLDELLAAIIAFDSKRSRRLEREKLLP